MKLKVCPFCGGEAVLLHNDDAIVGYWVVCKKCKCMTIDGEKNLVIKAWNTRKVDRAAIERAIKKVTIANVKAIEYKDHSQRHYEYYGKLAKAVAEELEGE